MHVHAIMILFNFKYQCTHMKFSVVGKWFWINLEFS